MNKNYKIINYLIIIYLISIAIIYMCAFRHMMLDVNGILPDDRGYFLGILRHILNANLTIGMIMYWIYWFYNKKHILVSYLIMSLINIILGGVLISINYLLLFETVDYCKLHKLYVLLTLLYGVSLASSIVLLIVSICILILSLIEIVNIFKGKGDVYTTEDDFVVNSKISNIFCVVNIFLIVLLIIDKFEVLQTVSIRDLMTRVIDIEALLIVVYPVSLGIVFINRLIRRNKKVKALIAYIVFIFACYAALYTGLTFFAHWREQLFILGLTLVIFGYSVSLKGR